MNLDDLYCLPRSGDSTARIWTIADGPSTSAVYNGPLNVAVLKHFKGRTNEKSKDVTTLDWNVSFHALIIRNNLYLCVSNQLSRSN